MIITFTIKISIYTECSTYERYTSVNLFKFSFDLNQIFSIKDVYSLSTYSNKQLKKAFSAVKTKATVYDHKFDFY